MTFLSLLWLRMRLLFKQRSFWGLYIGLVILIVAMMLGLYQQINQGLVIAVGVVNEGEMAYNEKFIQAMDNEKVLHVTKMTRQEGENALRDQRIEALYILPQDMESKMMAGRYNQIFTIVYLADNAFAVMLTDIVSGIFLDESARQTAARYYHDAMKELKEENVPDIDNAVYQSSEKEPVHKGKLKYLDISWKDGVSNVENESRQILLEKMTVGVIQILIGFFIVYSGMHLLGEESADARKRLYGSPIRSWMIQLSGWVVMLICGGLAIVPMIAVGVYSGKGLGHLLIVYVLYVLAMTGFVQGFMVIAKKPMVFVFGGTMILMVMGMLSGSFYSVGSEALMANILSKIFPSFYAIESYFDKGYILEYSIYTSVYCCIMWTVHAILERKAIEN